MAARPSPSFRSPTAPRRSHYGRWCRSRRGLPGSHRTWTPSSARLRARRRGVAVEERGAGDAPFVAGDLRVEVLWPPRGEAARGLRDNDRSLVLRVELEGEGTRVLLPGDIEAAAEAALVAAGAPLAADVLKLPHHGSRTSSGAVFLARVGAALAIASAPCLGRFAMPHTEVRRGAAAAGASLWWTGRDGAVVVSLSRPLVGRGLAPAGRPRERWRCQGEDAARESRSGEGAARAPVGRRAPELPSWGAQAAADADKGTNG